MFPTSTRAASLMELIAIFLRFFALSRQKALFLPMLQAVFQEKISAGTIGIAVDHRKIIHGIRRVSMLSASEMISIREIML